MVYSNSTARLYTSSDKEESSGATFNLVDEVELKLKQDYSKKFINIDSKLRELMESYISSKIQKVKSANT